MYPVGIDPIWYGTKQELPYLNSFKMKISVILAIAHMSLGIVQKAFNAIYFKDMPKLLHEFLPQLILLLVIFGYMDVLIIIKWNTNYTGHTDQAPSIIVTIVNFFLNGGEVKGQEFFTGNVFCSQVLLCKSSCYYELLTVVYLSSDCFGNNPLDVAGKPVPAVERG